MFEVLSHPVYRRLFGAQVIALVGTGLATIALALLAYELAGAQAGAVLGTALAIKMIAYVVIAPIASAVVAQLPRRTVLVALDLVRAGVALCLPFVTQIWEVYLLIFLLQSASAGFTPTFQAVIPDLFDSEERYTNALSLSRLAYDLENLLSPLLAAALLTIVSFNWLFMGTSAGFLISAALVLSVTLPRVSGAGATPFFERLTSGARSFFSTPRLRGLMAINLAVAAGGSFVIINTVVLVQSALGLSEQATALAFAAFGAGSMVVALTLPRLLTTVADRPVMLLGAGLLSAGTALAGVVTDFAGVLALWFCLGLGSASAQLPAGRLLRRSADSENRPALFAAQFALSHAGWLITYPAAGLLGAQIGLAMTGWVLAALGLASTAIAMLVWPAHADEPVLHHHPDLPPDHPHLREGDRTGAHAHRHPPIIDERHGHWPRPAG